MAALGTVRWKGTHKKTGVSIFTLLMLLFAASTRGNEEEVPVLPSNHPKLVGSEVEIKIETSSSMKETKTVMKNIEEGPISSSNKAYAEFITTKTADRLSEAVPQARSKKKRHLDDNSIESVSSTEKTILQTSSRIVYSDEYNFIQPSKTKPGPGESKKIEITKFTDSGEVKGVPMTQSGPRNTSDEDTNFESTRNAREFHSMERRKEKRKENDDLHNLGTNYNKIEQSLGSIAKITVNGENGDLPVIPIPPNFRKSRDEENRKANPDIQDIITGIVKILHGKANGQNHHEGNRPRPQPSRINNRGPPRISDLPPLDFDTPPSYIPLPPQPSMNRIPPPYPFDIPPSPPPNIPLPPQPSKPGMSKLPTHPFIEGVPIPELLVPDKSRPDTKPDYDTISMSEPSGQIVPPIFEAQNTTGKPTMAKTNSTTSKTDSNKFKVPPQKVMPNNGQGGNKNGNKRVRPRPSLRPRPSNDTRVTKPPEVSKKPQPPFTMKPVTEIIIETTTDSDTEPPVRNRTSQKPAKQEVLDSQTTEKTSKPAPVATSPSRTTEKPSILMISPTTTLVLEQSYTRPVDKKDPPEQPLLLDPIIGVGEATPVLEPSTPAHAPSPNKQLQRPTPVLSSAATSKSDNSLPTNGSQLKLFSEFEARPGIVLDDPEYKPGGHKRPPLGHRPIITAPPAGPYGEIFDVTVHAVQGGDPSPGKPVVVAVNLGGAHLGPSPDVSVITKPQVGQDFVSIDGKRTYINLFGETTTNHVAPTTTQPPVISGTSYPAPAPQPQNAPGGSSPLPVPPRRPYKRPVQPPVRIDTCIVGDDTTCDQAQNERCQTEEGVSSCHCRPGYNRKKHRDPCRRVISMMTSLRVDRLYDRKLNWRDNFRDPESDEYQELSYEASQAIESAMSMTPFSDDFITSRINSIYVGKSGESNQPAIFVNMTIQLEENLDTMRPAVRHDIQRHLIRVIHRRNNNVGNSAVWVDSPPGSVLALEDVDECTSWELHDCHSRADCSNTFGSFKCQCQTGLRDPWVGNVHREGRHCESCGADFCNNKGECRFEHGLQVCHCTGSFYGSQCEIDGEVLGVAIGASVAAAIIIILTLVCLCMWSRRWSREQKSAVGAGMGSPVFGFMAGGPTVKTPNVGAPPYQISIEERIRWAQMADVMAHANLYAQPEPGNDGGRASYGGYPTLPTHSMGSLPLPAIAPPVPLPRLTLAAKGPHSTYGGHSQHGSIHQSTHRMRTSLDTSSSEEEDRADLLGRHFSAPRPKSRASVTNQSGIYYDVDLERAEMYGKQTIPMNTYTMNSQHQIRPFFR